MPEQVDTDQRLLARLCDVLDASNCVDWGAKLQDLCKTIWLGLEEENDIGSDAVETFIKILEQEHSFAVARLVIPEFRREPQAALQSLRKQQIMTRTKTLRANYMREKLPASSALLFNAEKEIYTEAEIYRAGLLLYKAGLDAEDRRKVQDWLHARPGNKTQGQTLIDDDLPISPHSKTLPKFDLYRAGLLVFPGGIADVKQQTEISMWLATRPGATPESEGDTEDSLTDGRGRSHMNTGGRPEASKPYDHKLRRGIENYESRHTAGEQLQTPVDSCTSGDPGPRLKKQKTQA